ncbi:PREDICTED: uncharacterized protein LOC106815265 [Priapulus caudatus]|uniref:Uncharacterized protein LOC106815265 n=1 Tax=Priapulus caudatus TaxID=37621 RepID=A0ABM1ESM7_PRICU|nr:PREDICTED: uncharacterized protein LOC106815265 [Priapulus caudatus]
MKGNDGPTAKLWPNHALIDIFHIALFEFTSARDLLTRCQRITSLLPWQLTEANSKQKFELLTCSSIGRRLYGSERVTIDQIPYMPTPGNYSVIMENENPHVIVELFHGRYVSVSFGSVRGVSDPNKLTCTINVYSKDAETVIAHAYRQIADVAKQNLDKEIYFNLYTDVCFSLDPPKRNVIIDAITQKLGLRPLKRAHYKDLHVITGKYIGDSKPLPLLPLAGVKVVSKI